MHLDGARSWNAALYHGMTMKEYTKDFDLVNVCLSKGMGCPAMSVIAGSKADIDRALVFRKMLGGGMRQTGILSAAALVSLMDWEEKLSTDNLNAKWLGEEIADIKALKDFDPSLVETNIVKFKLDPIAMKKLKLDHNGVNAKLREHDIWAGTGFHNDHIRFVVHRGTPREH